MTPTTYVARQPGPFSALLQARELGGFRLQALPPRRVNDRYEDTDDGALLARGLTLRIREQEGEWSAALRPIRRGLAGPTAEASYGIAWTPPDGPLPLPEGDLAQAVRQLVGGDPVAPLLRLRQYRTPRLAYDGERLVALVSFDVVVYETPGANIVSNELEIERAQGGTEADLRRLLPTLLENGLEPVRLSKLERGVLRLHRGLDEPLLLLPDERAALDDYVASAEPLLQRRARVVQLDARGYRALTIAGQVGLSTSRVRHWQQQFRQHRMGIFEPADGLGEPASRAVPSYRVSEIVDQGDGSAPDPVEPSQIPPPAPPRTSVGDGSPSQSPFAEGPTVAVPASAPPDAPDPSGEGAGLSGDPDPKREAEAPDAALSSEALSSEALSSEAAPPERQPEDMAELLEMFQPSGTETPHLDEEDELDRNEEDEPDRGDERPDAERSDAERSDDAAPASVDDVSPLARAGHRRAFLAPDTPILTAAHDTLAHYIAAYDRAVGAFHGQPTPRAAQRLLLAAHRVRLAIEAFDAYLPEAAAARLVSALRPLAAALDHGVELERVREVGVDDAATARDEALDAARAHLTPARHRIWMERADRVVGRLAAQVESGLLIGDDFPTVPDDWVGQPGERPVPSRLRHILASVVWERYESVRAFEDEVEGELSGLTAHHLAVAVSGLHFALGLASKTSDVAAVREAAAHLDEAERVVAAFRTATRSRRLETTADDVREAWASLEEAAFRQLLGTITAAI